MSVLYAVLGLFVGMMIAELFHRPSHNGAGRHPAPTHRAVYASSAKLSTPAASRSCRFVAQDYYDR